MLQRGTSLTSQLFQVHVVAVTSTNVKALVTATVAHLQHIAAQQVVTVPQAARAHSRPAQPLTSRPTVPAVSIPPTLKNENKQTHSVYKVY
jgi:hypothetical protein